MISFADVHARYPTAEKPVIAGVSLCAEPSRLSAVVGPNGSGKSTLVKILLQRIEPTHGEVVVGGHPLRSWPSRELARTMAVLPQREESTFTQRVSDYVMLGRLPHRGNWAGEGQRDHDAVERALERAGVTPFRERLTDELSGGEWQRVRLARALAQDPQVIVLDEPTTYMDVAHEMATFEILSSLANQGLTVLVVSHQLNLVARFAHHVVLLDRGQVAASGTPLEVMQGSILERVYEWPLVVTHDAAVGAPNLVPLRRS